MLQSSEKKKSTKYANIDMDKFKFDFNLFVPSEIENSELEDENKNDL